MIELSLLNDEDKNIFVDIFNNIKTEFNDTKETRHLNLTYTPEDNSDSSRIWHSTSITKTLEINSDDISQSMADLLAIEKFYIFQSMIRAKEIFVYISKGTFNRRICYTAYIYWKNCVSFYAYVGLFFLFLKKWHNQATWKEIISRMYTIIIGFILIIVALIIAGQNPKHFTQPDSYTLDVKYCPIFMHYVNTTCSH